MRTYERTHTWIKFSVKDIARAGPELWAALGECQSKSEHIAGVPLTPYVADRLHRLYLAKGILGTTAIEGNTLSEREVLDILDGRSKLPPSREYLAQEVENIIEGCQWVYDRLMAGNPLPLNVDTFCALNKIVLSKLTLADEVVPGEVRQHSVGVLGYRGAPPEDCVYLLDRLGKWLSGPDFDGPQALSVSLAIIKAIMAHLYLAWIHPFGDGNGRTARLVEFQLLMSCGVPTPVVHLLSNHYNQTRNEYYRQLAYASKSGGEIVPFVRYAVNGLLDGLRAQIQEIRQSQLEIMWRYYVHEQFSEKKSEKDKRQRDLVLGLSNYETPVPVAKMGEVTKESAVAYAKKTRMTLLRDIGVLQGMGLIRRQDGGFIANKKLIEAFLPDRADIKKLAANAVGSGVGMHKRPTQQ